MGVSKEITALFLRVMDMAGADILESYDNPGRGITNSTYVFRTTRGDYLLRIPGQGTDMFCDRAYEYELYKTLESQHITDEVCYFEPDTGVRVTVYYPDCHVIDTKNEDELTQAMALLRRFHGLALPARPNTALQRMAYYIECVEKIDGGAFYPEGYEETRLAVLEHCSPYYDGGEYSLVHGDCLPHNVLFPAGRSPVLIDWEYAGGSDPWEDLGDFCHDGDLGEDECVRLLRIYLGREPERAECRKLFAMCASAALMWATWSVFKAKMEEGDRPFYVGYAQFGADYARESLRRMRHYDETGV